jgi:hypothetical protein
MRVVAVATTHPLEELMRADVAVQTLDQLKLDVLDKWFAERNGSSCLRRNS